MMESEERPNDKLVALPPRQRGSYANKFRNVEITSNHFEATLRGISKIVIFSLKVTPPIQADNAQLREQIIRSIRDQVERKIRNSTLIKKIQSSEGFASSKEQCSEQQFEVHIPNYTITIAQKKVYEVAAKPHLFLNFLNNSLRGIMSRLNYIQIGRTGKYFTTAKPTPIDNLQMYKGFSSSFMQCQRGMFLRVDTARKIVRGQTALDTINALYKQHQDKDKEEKRNEVKKALVNSIVMTNYGKCTFYRVIDVTFKSMMEVRVSEECPTLKDYYKKKYNIDIKNQNQPLLQAQNKVRRKQVNGTDTGPTYLLPQLCLMTGIPDDFDENRRKSISQATILPPSDKFRQIEGFMKQLQKHSEVQKLSQIGINLSSRMNKFQTKQISNPSLQLGYNQFVQKNKQAFFSLFNNPIYSAKHSISCVILHPSNSDISQLQSTIEKTSKVLKADITINAINMAGVFKDKDVMAGIDKAMKNYPDANMLLIVIPNNLKGAYPKLKQYTLSTSQGRQILTQFVTDGTLRRKSGVQTIHTKLLLQMLAKRGNILWIPSYQEDISRALDKTMLIGIDSASRGGLTLLAGCGTINSTFSLLASDTKQYEGNEKKFTAMLSVTTKCLQSYISRNKSPPSQLIIFMNCSPGDQINLYKQFFSQPLVKQMSSSYNTEVRLTVIMVNLRNSERFFTVNGSEVRNVFPGTLVSSCVVSKAYDFFIVSQQSNKGCVVPNHYKVIHSTSKLEQGHLQELIFSQCFNYVNWTGSIKIPAILQYAKKCARFNAEVLGGINVAEGLLTRPYFI